MPVTEFKEGKTPHGGVRSTIVYLKDGELAEKDQADSAEIIEYKEDGTVAHRTYLAYRRKRAVQD